MSSGSGSSSTIAMIDNSDFERLENKVDNVMKALNTLILVEERQTNQGIRIGENEKAISALYAKVDNVEKKLDQWVNRGIGVWGVVLALWALIQTFYSHLGGK